MPKEKSFEIPKQLVWDAYQWVKADRGAAGVDGESLAIFEKNLKGNLYKIWNRMASGSYIPPPVRLVEIPKGNGGKCPLGIPTVADRVAHTIVKMVLEPKWNLGFIRIPKPSLTGWIMTWSCALWFATPKYNGCDCT